jgi:hypothetical protein
MIGYRCQCGKRTASSSMGVQDCEGCDECKTTYATNPDGHKPLEAHVWMTRYNQTTGKPFKVCNNCMRIDEESYNEAKKK